MSPCYVWTHEQWFSNMPMYALNLGLALITVCDPLQAILVHTAETVRYRYFVDLLMEHRRPVMLVGSAGCGKTVLINDKLAGERVTATIYIYVGPKRELSPSLV